MNSGTFIRSASKLPPSGTAKAPPARNPPIKRKRPDEPFQRSVQAKMTPSNDIYSRRDSGFISIPKLAINSGIASASKLSTTTYSQTAVKAKTVIQSRTTFQTPAAQSTTKKGRGTTPVTTRVSNTKVDIKISSIEKGKSDEKSDVKETMMISPVKKSLNIEHFEGLASVSKEIDSEKDNLLSNLNNLVEELTGKQNPLLEENDNKLFLMQDTFEKQKVQQKEELEKLNSKINNLKNAQSSLSRLFEESKEKNSVPEQENQVVDLNIMKYNESITKTKCHLSNLLRKNEDLNTFIYSVEEAIRNTKSKVRSRYNDITSEEKKVLILTELVNERKSCLAVDAPQN